MKAAKNIITGTIVVVFLSLVTWQVIEGIINAI